MLLSERHRFIFLKTIKTAGTSVELALQQRLLPNTDLRSKKVQETAEGIVGARGSGVEGERYWHHMSAQQLRRTVGPAVFDDYLKASIIRNPFDKVVSWFFFGFHRPVSFDVDRKVFNEFIESGRRLPVDRNIYTIGGKVCCQKMLRFETLQADVDSLLSILSPGSGSVDLPREKGAARKEKRHFQDYYNEPARTAVAKAFDFELNAFDYVFHE